MVDGDGGKENLLRPVRHVFINSCNR